MTRRMKTKPIFSCLTENIFRFKKNLKKRKLTPRPFFTGRMVCSQGLPIFGAKHAIIIGNQGRSLGLFQRRSRECRAVARTQGVKDIIGGGLAATT